mmetsp:Transcript_60058/g.186307  ORF Transcript_60058/g.186307 Transcript_60058/m.186307 type:complete len:319 (-) Transcript_60058:3-959(-)
MTSVWQDPGRACGPKSTSSVPWQPLLQLPLRPPPQLLQRALHALPHGLAPPGHAGHELGVGRAGPRRRGAPVRGLCQAVEDVLQGPLAAQYAAPHKISRSGNAAEDLPDGSVGVNLVEDRPVFGSAAPYGGVVPHVPVAREALREEQPVPAAQPLGLRRDVLRGLAVGVVHDTRRHLDLHVAELHDHRGVRCTVEVEIVAFPEDLSLPPVVAQHRPAELTDAALFEDPRRPGVRLPRHWTPRRGERPGPRLPGCELGAERRRRARRERDPAAQRGQRGGQQGGAPWGGTPACWPWGLCDGHGGGHRRGVGSLAPAAVP